MRRNTLAALVVSLFVASALAREAGLSRVPVDRIEANLLARQREHPDDAESYYILGRLCAFAFAADTTALREQEGAYAKRPESLKGFDQQRVNGYDRVRVGRELQPLDISQYMPTAAQSREFVLKGMRNLRKAIELAPNEAKHHLTLAFLLERARHLADRFDLAEVGIDMPATTDPKLEAQIANAIRDLASSEQNERDTAEQLLRARLDEGAYLIARYRLRPDRISQRKIAELLECYWLRCSVREYKIAFDLSITPDLTKASTIKHENLVSWDAASAFIRLHVDWKRSLPEDASDLAQMTEALSKFDAVPFRGFISPIILSTSTSRSIDDLVDDHNRVCFDLDGDGRVESCTWVRPTTGILVWDPDHAGHVESGRDLFGNATWWMLFSNGYRALDTLDDDRDGWLTGNELAGIGVWYDFDSNGHADVGEVVPLEATDVRALSTRFDAHEGNALRASGGMLMRDGTRLATYDWYADCTR